MITSLFVCLFGFLTSSSTTRLYRGRAPRQERLTILRAATHETDLGDHDFHLSRSHYTDTDSTCRERAATAGIEPGTSSPGVARSTAELPRPPMITSARFVFKTAESGVFGPSRVLLSNWMKCAQAPFDTLIVKPLESLLPRRVSNPMSVWYHSAEHPPPPTKKKK